MREEGVKRGREELSSGPGDTGKASEGPGRGEALGSQETGRRC